MSASRIQKTEAARQPLLSSAYLRSFWSAEYEAWRESDAARALHERLRGQTRADAGDPLQPLYAVKNAGQTGAPAVSLIDDSEAACFQRVLFARLFHSEWLLASTGAWGGLQVHHPQGVRTRAIDDVVYESW